MPLAHGAPRSSPSHVSTTRFGSPESMREIDPGGTEMKQATTTGTGKYEAILERCRSLEPMPTAVGYPWEASALTGAVKAAQNKLLVSMLVGPAGKMAGNPR